MSAVRVSWPPSAAIAASMSRRIARSRSLVWSNAPTDSMKSTAWRLTSTLVVRCLRMLRRRVSSGRARTARMMGKENLPSVRSSQNDLECMYSSDRRLTRSSRIWKYSASRSTSGRNAPAAGGAAAAAALAVVGAAAVPSVAPCFVAPSGLKAAMRPTARRKRPPVLSRTMRSYSASVGHALVSRHRMSWPWPRWRLSSSSTKTRIAARLSSASQRARAMK
mmetsp:Transcript_6461/g.27187  ORF Transcript_6461/g.27187 Transcript_6461/m.27187 type:complete len:221 (-) Transcript_6461:372-1034(-)